MFEVSKKQRIRWLDLGLVSYQDAWNIQKKEVNRVLGGDDPVIVTCEHPPVITLGRMSRPESLLSSREELTKQGIEVFVVDRGGDVTLHAPGQLVLYPILDLNNFGRDLHAYLHRIEAVGLEVLRHFEIEATRNDLNTGLWVGSRKLMSIGIGVKRWVSYHGLGLNVQTDLSLFRLMKPCGLEVEMTSMALELERKVDIAMVKNRLIDCFRGYFQLEYKTQSDWQE